MRWRLVLGLALLAIAAGAPAASRAIAQPDGPVLSRWPYVQDVTAATATIAWATDTAGAAEVRLSADGASWQTVAASSRFVDDQTYHSAALTGLAPATRYFYRTWVAGSDLTPWGSVAFTTATTGSNFSFVALGGSRGDSPGAPAQAAVDLAAQMGNWAFDLALHTGDLAIAGSYDQLDSQYFGVYRDLIGKRPFFTALGDHDYGVNPPMPYLDDFYLPQNGPAGLVERVYSFDWGNAHFVSLETGQSYTPGSAQYAWLESDLAHTTAFWKFVSFHHPPYSSSSHGSDLDVRAALGPLFEKYAVDLVFTGRDHGYERTYPMIGGSVASGTRNGVVYFVTGGGGAPTDSFGSSSFTAFSRSTYHFTRTEVHGCALVLQAIDSAGAVFDSFTLDKCSIAWTQVNADGFAEHPGVPYASQEGFDLTVFRDQLYLGMEGQYCARIWRSKAGVTVPASQADWEQVVANGFDGAADCTAYPPATANDHIDSLEPFGEYLYASTAIKNDAGPGTQVWRSPSGNAGDWMWVNRPGFGSHTNENFKDMAVFQGYLCGGTRNAGELAVPGDPAQGYAISPGAQVWCTDGAAPDPLDTNKLLWTQHNVSGFGDADNVEIWSSTVYSGALYVGVEGWDPSPAPEGSPRGGGIWRTRDIAIPTAWEQVFAPADAGMGDEVSRIDVLDSLGGYLYVGFHPPGYGTQIWRSPTGEQGSWSAVVSDGLGDRSTRQVISDGAITWDGALYVATFDQTNGTGVWRTADGASWRQMNAGGFGDRATFAAELLPFHGRIYAWTSNWTAGQGVWQGMLRTPAPVTTLAATAQGEDLRLDWLPVTADTTGHPDHVDRYDIYCSPQPYIDLSSAAVCAQVGAPGYTDPGVIGIPGTAHFYAVAAVNAAGQMSASPWVGVVNYPLFRAAMVLAHVPLVR